VSWGALRLWGLFLLKVYKVARGWLDAREELCPQAFTRGRVAERGRLPEASGSKVRMTGETGLREADLAVKRVGGAQGQPASRGGWGWQLYAGIRP
jgi:hypothetical protein